MPAPFPATLMDQKQNCLLYPVKAQGRSTRTWSKSTAAMFLSTHFVLHGLSRLSQSNLPAADSIYPGSLWKILISQTTLTDCQNRQAFLRKSARRLPILWRHKRIGGKKPRPQPWLLLLMAKNASA